jgi:NSS family neurotransmitter:Na+ symporter
MVTARSSLAVAGACFATGLTTIFSFNLWADWHPLAALPGFAQATLFDVLDYMTSNVLLPVGGFAIALFAGWIVPVRTLIAELGLLTSAALLATLRYAVRSACGLDLTPC